VLEETKRLMGLDLQNVGGCGEAVTFSDLKNASQAQMYVVRSSVIICVIRLTETFPTFNIRFKMKCTRGSYMPINSYGDITNLSAIIPYFWRLWSCLLQLQIGYILLNH
jgi:hypothetical protein